MKEKEVCVLCKKETEVLKCTPVYEREHYVECAGQLCKKCWEELYGSNV